METCCARCGSEMRCDPAGACWCKELPAVMPLGSARACLCRDCLVGETRIFETGLLTAAFRANESARADSLFTDPFARMLAGERGADLARGAKGAAVWEFAVAVRTRVFDELLFAVFAENRVDVVVNFGAGLDARPYRLEIPGHVRWIEADDARVLDHKNRVLAGFRAACPVERKALDVTDPVERRTFLGAAAAGASNVLIVTEGVLAYFSGDEVAAIAEDLRASAGARWWILDHPTSIQLELAARAWDMPQGDLPSGERFAPRDVAQFFAAHGWPVARALRHADSAAAFGRVAPRAAVEELIPYLPSAGLADDGHADSGYALLCREGTGS